MKDTPETDAHSPASYAIIGPNGVRTDYVPADFARKLERERDQARNLADAAMWEADRLRPRINLRPLNSAPLVTRHKSLVTSP